MLQPVLGAKEQKNGLRGKENLPAALHFPVGRCVLPPTHRDCCNIPFLCCLIHLFQSCCSFLGPSGWLTPILTRGHLAKKSCFAALTFPLSDGSSGAFFMTHVLPLLLPTSDRASARIISPPPTRGVGVGCFSSYFIKCIHGAL